jgi:protein CpxP
MTYAINRTARVTAVGLTVSLLALMTGGATAAMADETAGPLRLAQAGPAPAASGAGPGIDSQISDLRSRLQITPAQQPKFDAVAQIMRQNAQAMEAAMRRTPPRNAVEDMRVEAEAAAAEAAQLQRMLPAFEALYASLSEEQKHMADQLFAGAPSGGEPQQR